MGMLGVQQRTVERGRGERGLYSCVKRREGRNPRSVARRRQTRRGNALAMILQVKFHRNLPLKLRPMLAKSRGVKVSEE